MKKLDITEIKVGDVLQYWFDTGAMGPALCYVRVLKVGTKKIRVKFEQGGQTWKYPWWFSGKVDPENVAELIEEGTLKI